MRKSIIRQLVRQAASRFSITTKTDFLIQLLTALLLFDVYFYLREAAPF